MTSGTGTELKLTGSGQKVHSDSNYNEIPAAEEDRGKIYHADQPIPVAQEDILKWPSLGHYMVHKLESDHTETSILLDVASNRRWFGAQLKDKVLNVAAALIDKNNLKRGDTVCMSFDHSDMSCILALGVICAGGIVATAYPKDPYCELLYLARKVEPKLLFCHQHDSHWSEQLSKDLGYKVEAITMGDNDRKSTQHRHFEEYLNYDHKTAKCAGSVPVATKHLKRQVALVTMSSGTTGKPKVVPATHWNCITDMLTLDSRARSRNTHFACTASLDYVSGRIIILGAIELGYTAVILNGFEPKPFLAAVEKYKINLIYIGAASFFNLITYEHIDDYDLSSLRVVFPMGAKIIFLDELAKFFNKHPNITAVRQGFGASELSGVAMNAFTPEEYLKDCANCGRLLAGMSVKIVDENTGELLRPNQTGMLLVGGHTVFPGYYDIRLARERGKIDPVTGELDLFFGGPEVFDEDGYYITGDLAYMNEKEELYFVGRCKELMSCRGAKKVLPQELEELIEQHPAVNKVCVIGIANKRELTLHCPRAFITPKASYYTDEKVDLSNAKLESQDGDELQFEGENKLCSLPSERRRLISRDLMAFVNERIGWEKQLTGGIVILDDIPTSKSTGKLNKGYLRSLSLDQVEVYGDRSN